jgi:hypothetical protein
MISSRGNDGEIVAAKSESDETASLPKGLHIVGQALLSVLLSSFLPRRF